MPASNSHRDDAASTAPGDMPGWMADLFQAIDSKDAERFVRHLSLNATFRFGSAEPVHGRDNIRDAVAGFFAAIQALQHDVYRTWSGADTEVCEGRVSYTRLDGSDITLPFVDVFTLRDGAIDEYLIYMDIGPLFAD